MWYNTLLEKNLVPDTLIRAGIRYYNRQHLKRLAAGGPEAQQARRKALLAQISASPLAIETEQANQQHYEVPAAFFKEVLGPHLKYSCGYWQTPDTDLAQSEAAMLDLCCQRAQLADGQSILELGCGWGSWSLYMAQRYPAARIVGVSNSASQRAWILARAAERGLSNLDIITADINVFEPGQCFDRIVSVEMFEHLRNYARLFERLAQWLQPEGKLFVHVFAHQRFPYVFEVESERDWMAKYFFSGGTMPSVDLLPGFAGPLQEQERWLVDGSHYEKTSNAWLARMDARRKVLMPLLGEIYGPDQALKWWVYWRIFFMACAELFGHAKGQEWLVVHYLFAKAAR